MGYDIGNITSGSSDAHYQFIGKIKSLAESNGWTTLRYDTSGVNHELIMVGEGLSGTEEIYVGFQSYQSIPGDYYNINCGVFTGYVSGNSFASQPGANICAFPAHNNAIDYWMTANEQRIVACLKVGTPVYEHFYVGKILPYARPTEYPYPVVNGSMLSSGEARRHSDTNQFMPYMGYREQTTYSRLYIRNLDGAWIRPSAYPFSNYSSKSTSLAGAQGTSTMVPAGDHYQIEPIILYEDRNDIDPKNVYGEFDGVYFCTGFNNGPENVIQIGGDNIVNQTGMTIEQAVDAILLENGRAFVMSQNVHRTSWRDYVALEMK